ncbi:MAG: hypothetical protein ACTSUT_18275 [Promethearchaeota archaeon]
MNAKQKGARIDRMNDAFDKCVDGTKESSIAVFGVDSFPALIGKKFYFLVEDFYLLNDRSDVDPNEAFLGQVTGINFRFLVDGLEIPDGKDWKEYLAESVAIVELAGQTCFPFLQTTVGELCPPWGGYQPWTLDPPDGKAGWEGSVIFLG